VRAKPNILLIVMDCVRFDYLSVYGYPRPTTPNLERLAADGVVFENAFAAAPWTPPSHASLFTGTYPSQHGVDVNENLYLSEQNITLAQVLAEHGYRTFGVLPDAHLSNVRGFDKGFQDTVELWRIPYWKPEYDWLACLARNMLFGRDKMTYYSNKVMQRWLSANSRGPDPFFLFVNYKTAHNSYHCPRPFRQQFETASPGVDRRKAEHYSNKGGYSYMAGQLELTEDELQLVRSWYSSTIAYLDARIGEMVAFLKAMDAYDNTLIIITADHGENLGEHHLAYHLFCLYDTLLHVPLLMSCPALLPHGRRINGMVSLTDVMPTILALLDMEQAVGPLHGTSLTSFNGDPYHEQVFAEFGRPRYMLKRLQTRFPGHDFSAFDRGLQCIRTPHHKLIVGSDGKEELYDLVQDPAENSNRIQALPQVAADLRGQLDRWHATIDRRFQGQQTVEDANLVKALNKLGYF